MLNHPILRLIAKFLLYCAIFLVLLGVFFYGSLIVMVFVIYPILPPCRSCGIADGILAVFFVGVGSFVLALLLTAYLIGWREIRPKQKTKRKPKPVV